MFRKLPYKTGSFPTGVSTLLLTLPVLTGERSSSSIKPRKPLCKAVFAHSLDILRLNYRHSRNLRHHSISLQYAFTRKIYYTAFRCGIQAFFKKIKIEFIVKNLPVFYAYLLIVLAGIICSFAACIRPPRDFFFILKRASVCTDALSLLALCLYFAAVFPLTLP